MVRCTLSVDRMAVLYNTPPPHQSTRHRTRRSRRFTFSSRSPAPPSSGATAVPRPLIGLFGEMNAGKSTLLNALTQQAAAIVDATPGTTADVKAALMELHGLGPVKVGRCARCCCRLETHRPTPQPTRFIPR